MPDRFDPNLPGLIEGDFKGGVSVVEVPGFAPFGASNLVLDPTKPFDINVSWHIFGPLTPPWLTALGVASPNWIVTAYAESVGPGPEIIIGTANVLVGAGPFSLDESYNATVTVAPGTLQEENPGDPTCSGVYKLVVTVFLDSVLGPVGYDIMGYAEGPVVKAENPL